MRPSIQVLRGLNLAVRPGQTVALVGQSGCGKSTIVQLLERFYDVTGGNVKVDGCDVREVQLQSLRRLISLVSQEPTLFNMTIRDNIVYGLGEQNVPNDTIISVARQANIHDFIAALPKVSF
jgi:ATP-binding cassette subfamily B (MDR/TAP) protein 1